MNRKFVLIFLLILVFLPGLTYAEDSLDKENVDTIYYGVDSVDDDYGPGSYRYPGHRVFDPGKGHYDLRTFEIQDIGEEYRFIFELGKIENPWEGIYNFSHQLIHIYFDLNSPSGQADLFRSGARVKLNSNFFWDYHLQLSGWWLRMMTPDDDPEDLIRDILNIDAEVSPWDIDNANIKVSESKILLDLSKDYLGDIRGSRFYLLLGGFDPFGKDNFRPVKDYATNWSFFYDQNLDNNSNQFNHTEATRVIDYFYPESDYQENHLGINSSEMEALDPVKIPAPEKTIIETIRDYKYLVAVTYILFSFVIILYILHYIMRSAINE
ncbi:MAG: glucodextranase DOMON-like domain-containing protein [Halarsenatibacteraceae bacterium]